MVRQIHIGKYLSGADNLSTLVDGFYDFNEIKFSPNVLEPLAGLNLEILNLLIESENWKKAVDGYKSIMGLELFFGLFDSQLLVISVGETNQNSFKLYVEGVWLIQD